MSWDAVILCSHRLSSSQALQNPKPGVSYEAIYVFSEALQANCLGNIWSNSHKIWLASFPLSD